MSWIAAEKDNVRMYISLRDEYSLNSLVKTRRRLRGPVRKYDLVCSKCNLVGVSIRQTIRDAPHRGWSTTSIHLKVYILFEHHAYNQCSFL